MHRHKRFRHGPPLFRPRRHFGGGFIWLIFMAMMFMGGRWWPAILVFFGLWMIFGSLFREEKPSEPHNPPLPFYDAPPPAAPRPAPAPVEQTHRVDLLPTTCAHCGGPIRSYEVKWTGTQSAACPYCGSNLTMKKTQ